MGTFTDDGDVAYPPEAEAEAEEEKEKETGTGTGAGAGRGRRRGRRRRDERRRRCRPRRGYRDGRRSTVTVGRHSRPRPRPGRIGRLSATGRRPRGVMLSRLPDGGGDACAEVATLCARLDEALAALVAERAEKERLAHLEHSPKMPTPTLPPPGSPLVASASARSRRGASVDFSSSSPPLSRAAALAPGFPSPGFSSPGFSSPESTSFDRRFSANASGSSRSVEPTALAASASHRRTRTEPERSFDHFRAATEDEDADEGDDKRGDGGTSFAPAILSPGKGYQKL